MLIKIENDKAVGHPVLEDNFKQLFPATQFPAILTNEIVNPFGFAMYEFTQVPDPKWDEDRTEGEPAKDADGFYRQVWVLTKVTQAERAVRTESIRRSNMVKIDHDVDRIYETTIGRRATEYLLAESEARAYADAGYAGEVPITVSEWAAIKGWTNKQAADDVLAAAAQWRVAQTAIRKQRLLSKDQMKTAVSVDAMNVLMTEWGGFVSMIREQLKDS